MFSQDRPSLGSRTTLSAKRFFAIKVWLFLVFRAGVALLDKDKPHKTIVRSRNWIFQAEAPYELSGLTPNVVFPTGFLLRGDELWMYYGAADSCTCLTTAKLDEVLALLID